MAPEAEQENAPAVARPHEVLWFDDGNVVLSTETWLFKVHKSVLSLQSSFFKDMFELPIEASTCARTGEDGRNGANQEYYEELPTVAMVGDKGRDVAHLLHAVYERQYYRRDEKNVDLEVVIALLILSTKYDFKHIRTDVIVQISKQYPMDFTEYEGIDDNLCPLFGTERWNCHLPLLKAACVAEADFLLPTLYYACAGFGLPYLFDHATFLGERCFRALIEGRQILEINFSTTIARLPEVNEYVLHINPDQNTEHRSCVLNLKIKHLDDFVYNTQFKALRGEFVTKKCVEGVCSICEETIAQAVDIKRDDLWDDLPTYFGLPSWDDLKNLKTLAELE